ncbi:MAG: glycerophosphodiester phosphodiesterase [Patescibacteria group bacterium]
MCLIIAHRGYHANIKENTLAAFDAAFAAGAGAVECDLRLIAGKVVVSHDFSREKNLLGLDELFAYIIKTDKQWFLEVKDNSRELAQAIINKIAGQGLWERVQIIGFWKNIRATLALQEKYPLLRVSQIYVLLPVLPFFKLPAKSYGVYFGWLDAIPGSRALFKLLITPARLRKLKARFESNGFKVMVGVVNQTKDLPFFTEAGIKDIFTDNVPEVVEYFRAKN